MHRAAILLDRLGLAQSGVLVIILCLSAASARAGANTWNVANNGVDAPGCGSKSQLPCRTITQAIGNASAGDTILVGPGVYSVFAGETGSNAPGCGCMIGVNKPVTVISTDGAAATVIDATNSTAAQNVLVTTGPFGGGTFGKSGHGFTVTVTAAVRVSSSGTPPIPIGQGIVIDSLDVTVEGNQVINSSLALDQAATIGISTLNGVMLVQGNQVVGWGIGISAAAPNTTVSNNVVTRSVANGISAYGISVVTGNVVTGAAGLGTGIRLHDSTRATGNNVLGNAFAGIVAESALVTIDGNNIFGNLGTFGAVNCGVFNDTAGTLLAANNYWGAASGPGPDPADTTCGGGTVLTTPFATKPFATALSPPIHP
jgi:hypothetical protein